MPQLTNKSCSICLRGWPLGSRVLSNLECTRAAGTFWFYLKWMESNRTIQVLARVIRFISAFCSLLVLLPYNSFLFLIYSILNRKCIIAKMFWLKTKYYHNYIQEDIMHLKTNTIIHGPSHLWFNQTQTCQCINTREKILLLLLANHHRYFFYACFSNGDDLDFGWLFK